MNGQVLLIMKWLPIKKLNCRRKTFLSFFGQKDVEALRGMK